MGAILHPQARKVAERLTTWIKTNQRQVALMLVCVGSVVMLGAVLFYVQQTTTIIQSPALIAKMEANQVPSAWGYLEQSTSVKLADGSGFTARVNLGNFPSINWQGGLVVSFLHQPKPGIFLGQDSQGRSYFAYQGWEFGFTSPR